MENEESVEYITYATDLYSLKHFLKDDFNISLVNVYNGFISFSFYGLNGICPTIMSLFNGTNNAYHYYLYDENNT